MVTSGAGIAKAGTGDSLSATSLKLVSGGTLDVETVASTLAGTLTSAGAATATVANTGALTVGTVDGTNGFVTSGAGAGAVDLSSIRAYLPLRARKQQTGTCGRMGCSRRSGP